MSECNNAGLGEAKEVAALMNTSENAEAFLVPAMVNAMRRIDHLERQLQKVMDRHEAK